MFSKARSVSLDHQRGFSLFEVLISSAIIGIVTAIVIIKYGGFNNSVLLKNQAYEVALAVREAQIFSISSKSDQNSFRDPYGIYVDLRGGGSNQTLILFQDSGGNGHAGRYVAGGANPDAIIDSLILDSRFEISDLCVVTDTGSDNCNVDEMSITFKRPDFDAKFNARNGGSSVNGSPYRSVSIELEVLGGGPVTRVIEVSPTGQITVQ